MSFKQSKISFAETKQFSKLFIDFINSDEKLKSFYAHPPIIDSFSNVLEKHNSENVNREILVKCIDKQYKNSQLPIPVPIAIGTRFLLDKNTFTVCTGHQLCLFTGPLYFIYKIISTINLAEKLKEKYPNCNFVPVYWMASEDHDFEEVSSINLFGKKVIWNNTQSSGAVGRLQTNSLDVVINELKSVLGDSANATELVDLFQNAYLKNSNLSDATRYIVDSLFGKYGLVVINADDEQLKRAFSMYIKDDILNATNYKLVNKSSVDLEKLGYKAQVNPREINCFYLKENIRERIEYDGNVFSVLNTAIKFSKEEISKEIDLHPERFSPNVVLRPLYQQYILPNVAYVGGPGELAYWLEYKAMFDYHKINYPVFVPRNFAILSETKINQQIEKLGLKHEDFFEEIDWIIKKYISKNSDGLSFKKEEESLTALFEAIEVKAMFVDKTLIGAVEAEKQKALYGLKNIESKILKAEKQKHEISINQIKKIKDKFFPNGVLQERHENLSSSYLKIGKEFIPSLKEVFNPFEFEMLILTID